MQPVSNQFYGSDNGRDTPPNDEVVAELGVCLLILFPHIMYSADTSPSNFRFLTLS